MPESRPPRAGLNRSPGLVTMRSLVIGLAALAIGAATMVRATETPPPEDPASGALQLRTSRGTTLNAVRLGTDMQVDVTGQTARVKVVQAFRNTGTEWVEATYLYPLPEDGAVDSLKMVVGQRVIVGEIHRREEARQIYETAKAEGQRAGLVEQQRPNMFTNKVANIGPGETVLIEIEFQAPVRRVNGEYSIRLPLVTGERYIPARTAVSAAGKADAAAITAPVAAPGQGMLNPVSIQVRLRPGFIPTGVVSPYHRVDMVEDGAAERVVTLAGGPVPADRDFELRWRSAETQPSVGLFRESMGRDRYLMAVVSPPAPDRRRPVPPRELVFVIDNSGSMSGESMDQAKASLKLALQSLTPADRFNVIRFDDSMTELFERPVPATREQVALAQRYADTLEAQGGTEMLPALHEALVDDTPTDAGRVRQVVFMTDGSIGNEDEMLAALGSDRGRSRVFMIGIGSAPNTFLMNRMAEVGRGTYVNISDTSEVAARMRIFLDRLTRPVATELTVAASGGAEFTPAILPDLYDGEPLVVLAKTRRVSGQLTVTGVTDGRRWTRTVDLSEAVEAPGVARLWAKRRITDIEVEDRLGDSDGTAATEAIAKLGLQYSLVTRETSLVAVDKTPARPDGARLREEDLPLNLPTGWDFEGLFGGPVGDRAASAKPEDAAELLELPQTAANWGTSAWLGLWLALFGAGGLWLQRRPFQRRRQA
ncbi:hypothetical protein ASC65_15880 [Brevundimonas sp. Root1279]|nr:hypothetical protein ASC65_15880 [Brevundimonas sp. Root1279]